MGSKNTSLAKVSYGKFSLFLDILFFIAIAVLVLISGTFLNNKGTPFSIMGYSYFTVLSSSMENELPKGSFVLVKEVDENQLKVRDNITFMKTPTTTVTHQIIAIFDNYNETGMKAFETKGVNNLYPDEEIVYSKNVIGKVVFMIPKAGAFLLYFEKNIYPIIISLAFMVVLSMSLQGHLAKKARENEALLEIGRLRLRKLLLNDEDD